MQYKNVECDAWGKINHIDDTIRSLENNSQVFPSCATSNEQLAEALISVTIQVQPPAVHNLFAIYPVHILRPKM